MSNTSTEVQQELHSFYRARTIRACRGRPSRPGFVLRQGRCIEWQGACNSKGYGYANGALVHRTAWEAICGPIPEGYEVHHRCRNKKCANVEHLEPLTREEHARAEGRTLKLDESKVQNILALVAVGVTQREIAERHGIARPYVSLIKSRRRWRWVNPVNDQSGTQAVGPLRNAA